MNRDDVLLKILKFVFFGVFIYLIMPAIMWIGLTLASIGVVIFNKLIHGNKKQYEVTYEIDGKLYTRKVWM